MGLCIGTTTQLSNQHPVLSLLFVFYLSLKCIVIFQSVFKSCLILCVCVFFFKVKDKSVKRRGEGADREDRSGIEPEISHFVSLCSTKWVNTHLWRSNNVHLSCLWESKQIAYSPCNPRFLVSYFYMLIYILPCNIHIFREKVMENDILQRISKPYHRCAVTIPSVCNVNWLRKALSVDDW